MTKHLSNSNFRHLQHAPIAAAFPPFSFDTKSLNLDQQQQQHQQQQQQHQQQQQQQQHHRVEQPLWWKNLIDSVDNDNVHVEESRHVRSQM
jgi:hypothetical protein